MTNTASDTQTARKRPEKSEFRQMVDLATPIVLTQLAWVAMLTTDTAMIGRLGADALAGASLSLMVFFLTWVFCFGVVMATASLASQAYGARDPRTVRRVIRQGLWIALLITTPALALFQLTPAFLEWTGQPVETLPHAEAYMSTLMWSLAPSIGYAVIRNFVSALNRPGPALWVMLADVPLNALLDYALIFGNFGLPRLELVGAGIATSVINWLMFFSLLAIAVWCKPFSKYAVLGRFWRSDWFQFRRIFKIGLPIAGMSLLEAGFFIGAIFVVGQFGATAIAATMIALQMPHITFMIPMGLGGDGQSGSGSWTVQRSCGVSRRVVCAGARCFLYVFHDDRHSGDSPDLCIDLSGFQPTR